MKLKYVTINEVVFAWPGGLEWLRAGSLEGLNLRVNSRAKKLASTGRFRLRRALDLWRKDHEQVNSTV